ncbi:MAG: tRNA 2-thiocytidine biosynthesis protein TtcA [Clostridia bacterium]|nr:tRNA 2-thiocytidine biosynthesis protein TtcA [Clostridia bacterium]
MSRELTRRQLIERSINKRFRKEIWRPFILAVKRYELIRSGDRIAVCISGGKDSMLLAKLMQELSRHSDVPFELRFLVMDPGYSPRNRRRIEENADLMGIPAEIFESGIFAAANASETSPCYLCARMRRGALYAAAQARGCNKIALGHHFNDVIETTVLGMFYGAQLQGMMPKLRSVNFPGMELIRPLYCVHEDDIRAWARYNQLEFLACACRFTEALEAAGGEVTSKRKEVKALLASLKKNDPDIEKSIFRSLHGLWPDTFPGWKDADGDHSFLERYDRKGGGTD